MDNELIKDADASKPLSAGKKKRKWPFVLGGIFLLLLILYIVLVYFLVSAALVPSFMEKLDAFSEVTDKGISEQQHTDDIEKNHDITLDETSEWLEHVSYQKYKIMSEDGYELIAMQFDPYAEAAGSAAVSGSAISGSAAEADTSSEDSHNWVLILHGYTGSKEEMYPFAMEYCKRGYHALVPDLRCQGESDGDFIGMGYTDSKDCLLWIDGILRLDKDARIVVHGQSMGAATALIMTGDGSLQSNVKAVVADSSYTDAYEMFRAKIGDWFSLPAFPLVDSARLMLMLRGGYDLDDASAVEAVKRSHTPTLFIHGDKDRMIDPDMSRELYAAESCPDKELFMVPGAGHAQPQEKDPKGYYDTVFGFLEKYMG